MMDAVGLDVTIHVRVPDIDQLRRDPARRSDFTQLFAKIAPKQATYGVHSAWRPVGEIWGCALAVCITLSTKHDGPDHRLYRRQVPRPKGRGLPQRWATRVGNLIVHETPTLTPDGVRAWSNHSCSSSRTLGPPDGRPNPRGVRVSRGHGENSVHRNAEVAQPPAVRLPRGTGIHAGLRMFRRRGRAPARRSGFHVARGASATCAFVGRGSRGATSQSAVSRFDARKNSRYGGWPGTTARGSRSEWSASSPR
jgi:hypothetical protein